MSTIDTRVVEAKFDGKQFERGVDTTLTLLQRLKAALRLDGATKGLEDVNRAANKKVSFAGMTSGIQAVNRQFSAMGVVGVTALATIANQAVMTGQSVAKSLTIAPITQGFQEYETKLGSIQTILANTQAAGTKLSDVNATLEELNRYSDQTIYNFGEMARNIGTFTAAGVDLKTSTASIKGIANLAALSGSSSEQAAGAMRQLSQEIAAGRVSLLGWNSVVTAQMGGTVFQRALAETAVAMGKLPASALKLDGAMKNVKVNGMSFRDSISAEKGPSWLTSDVLTTALSTFTGDMNAAQLATIGFNTVQINGILQTAKAAKDAATIVKTGTQLMGTLRESAASGWARTWEIIFGDFEEAKKLWTGVNNVLGGFINAAADKRNMVLGEWKDLGGRDMIIKGISNAFKALLSVLKPIKDAFRAVFPAKTGQDLYDLTVRFAEFTESLKIGGVTAQNLRRTFAGFFAVFSIVGQILGAALGQIGRFFSALGNGSGGFLNFTAGIGMFLVSLDKMLKRTGLVESFFNGLGNIIAIPLKLISLFAKAFGKLFTGFDTGGASKVSSAIDQIGKRLNPLQAAGERLRAFFTKIGDVLGGLGQKIGKALGGIGDAIAGAFASQNFSKTLDVINTGLLGGILLLIKNFLSGGLTVNLADGLFGGAKEAFQSVTDTMKSMQTQIKADTMIKIALALALLTASLVALSLLDSKKLAVALGGIGIGFLGLQAALVQLSTATTILGTLKLPLLVASMVQLAGALVLLSVALKIMSTISIGDTIQSLILLGGSLLIIAKTMQIMPKNLQAQAAGLILLGVALNLLAVALKIFATMSWDEMAHGLAALAGTLIAVAIAMRLMPKNIVLQAVAITILAGALNAMAIALLLFSTMSLTEIGTGLVVVAGSLAIIAGAMRLMPPNMLLQAAALVAVAASLNLLATALKIMSSMSWEEVAKGLVVLAGALGILAGGLYLMTGTLGGSAALIVAAGALTVLAPVLSLLGNLSWGTIVKGLASLAGIFVVLAVGGALLTPIIPVMIALAAAMVLIGAGLALAGVGAVAFATAFATVVTVGSAGVKVLAGILSSFVRSIPQAMKAFGDGIVQMASAIGRGSVAFVSAFSAIMKSILQAIINNSPLIARAFLAMLNAALKVVVDGAPKIAAAGLTLITRMLTVMNANVGRIVTVASALIVNFLNAISANLGKVIQAGVTLIINFINGVSAAIRNNSAAMGAAGANLGIAIVEGMVRGIASGIGQVTSAARRLASSALSAAKNTLGIKSPSKEFEKLGKYSSQGFVKGLTGNQEEIKESWTKTLDLIRTAVKTNDEDIKKSQEKLTKLNADQDRRVDAATAKLTKLNSEKKKDAEAIAAASKALAEAKTRDVKAIRDTTAAIREDKAERVKLMSAYNEMNKKLINERYRLETLATQYEAVTDKLEEANKALSDAKKTRDDYNASITDKYSDLPEINNETKLVDYLKGFEQKIADTREFSTAIQKLRDLGLSDQIYKELLSKGPDALPFINELLQGGKTSVEAINTLSNSLVSASSNLGQKAAQNLYQAGVDAAQGLVKGLESQQAEIAKQMEKIAASMVSALKKKLGIKSPSKEFAKLGDYSVKGLAQGLQQTSEVTRAIDNLGTDALNALRLSMSGLSDVVLSNMDSAPVITPVLDLSGVKKEAALLGGMLPNQSLSVGAAYANARHAEAGHSNNQSGDFESEGATTVQKTVAFTQINNSPKALNASEIYRQTKNQLSVAKGALAT